MEKEDDDEEEEEDPVAHPDTRPSPDILKNTGLGLKVLLFARVDLDGLGLRVLLNLEYPSLVAAHGDLQG
ncbi:unnamed protein product [Sphagnum tenellum]